MTNDMSRMFGELQEIFQDGILSDRTERTVKMAKIYDDNTQINHTIYPYNNELDMEVCKECSLDVAVRQLGKGKVGVAHFISPPLLDGGARGGIISRESVFSVRTDLYFCLDDPRIKDKFTENWYYAEYAYGVDDVLYLPGVMLCRDPNMNLLEEDDMNLINMFVSLTPYKMGCNITRNFDLNPRLIFEVYKSRLERIIDAAIDSEIDILVLGDLGCDANMCPPEIVADACREVLVNQGGGNAFKKVIFAVDEPYSQSVNGQASMADAFATSLNKPVIESSVYSKRQISIMGDSISTLLGYNPPEYKVFYSPSEAQETDIRSMEDTWWGKVIEYLDGYLLVNNSWSGSRVSYDPDSDVFESSAGCSNERTSALHINNVYPDVIIVYMGTNDWGFGVPLKESIFGKKGESTFAAAYETMLVKLKHNYPGAEIWCVSLNCTYMSADSSFVFPRIVNGVEIDKFNKEIHSLCKFYECRYIDTASTGLRYDSIDGTHPNRRGMMELADAIIRLTDRL